MVLLELLGTDAYKATERAQTVAEKIRLMLKLPYEVGPDDASFHTTASIRVTLFLGQEESGKSLLKHADVALYQAKAAGRDLVHFFDPTMQHGTDKQAHT